MNYPGGYDPNNSLIAMVLMHIHVSPVGQISTAIDRTRNGRTDTYCWVSNIWRFEGADSLPTPCTFLIFARHVDVAKLFLDCRAVATRVLTAPVATLPSAKAAAKAPAAPRICRTFLNWSWTLELSPHHILDCPRSPRFHLPKSQQKPSLCHKSAAHSHDHQSLDGPMSLLFHLQTFLSWSWTLELSPP